MFLLPAIQWIGTVPMLLVGVVKIAVESKSIKTRLLLPNAFWQLMLRANHFRLTYKVSILLLAGGIRWVARRKTLALSFDECPSGRGFSYSSERVCTPVHSLITSTSIQRDASIVINSSWLHRTKSCPRTLSLIDRLLFKGFGDGLDLFEFPTFAVRAVVANHCDDQLLFRINDQLGCSAHGTAAVLVNLLAAL